MAVDPWFIVKYFLNGMDIDRLKSSVFPFGLPRTAPRQVAISIAEQLKELEGFVHYELFAGEEALDQSGWEAV
jgi:hypothetical protein